MDLDVLIFGGGAAGLWLLDCLARRGDRVLLLEAGRLGQGQTIAAQGIIHGGLKYTLQGLLTPAAREIREMPGLWRQCLAGQRAPDLRNTRVRSSFCHLWRTDSLSSRLGMVGAKFGLRVAPTDLADSERPAVFANCPGPVSRLEEQVLSPASFIADLERQHRERILAIDADGLRFVRAPAGEVESVRVVPREGGGPQDFRPRFVVFTAGAGNADLRRACGLPGEAMQRRPLHMVMVRGELPTINGHCVDGAKTRVTITSDCDSAGRTVWQVGGQLSEEGVTSEPEPLLRHARAEIEAVLPGIDLGRCEWATYRVDRAERATPRGGRPDTATVMQEGNVITGWPTKLALAPQLAQEVESLVKPIGHSTPFDLTALRDWPRPEVAAPPWETAGVWHRIGGEMLPDARRSA